MTAKLGLTFIEGIIAFISPCVLPLLPMYLSFFAGSYIKGNEYDRKKVLKGLLGFVLGFTIIFILLGASATSAGKLLIQNKLLLKRISGILIIVLGLFYAGIINLKLLNRDFKINSDITSPTFLKSILFGFIFSLGWTPCIGPLIASALFMAADTDTLWKGVLLLFSFSLGLSLPLIVSALLFNKLIGVFEYIKKKQHIFKIVSGFILIVTGILIFIGFV